MIMVQHQTCFNNSIPRVLIMPISGRHNVVTTHSTLLIVMWWGAYKFGYNSDTVIQVFML